MRLPDQRPEGFSDFFFEHIERQGGKEDEKKDIVC